MIRRLHSSKSLSCPRARSLGTPESGLKRLVVERGPSGPKPPARAAQALAVSMSTTSTGATRMCLVLLVTATSEKWVYERSQAMNTFSAFMSLTLTGARHGEMTVKAKEAR